MVKKTLNKILEAGIVLAVLGIGMAKAVQNNSARNFYESRQNKTQKLYSIYKARNNLIHYSPLNQREFLNRGYFGK